MTYYLAYGSNLNKEQMAYRCPDAKVIGKTKLKGWKLVFNGVASIEPDRMFDVPVGVWKISKADEHNLDRYEGYPYLYRKETFTLSFRQKDGTVKYEDAIIYIMNRGRRKISPPSAGYYFTILQGYKDFKFEREILDSAVDESLIQQKRKYGEG